MMTNPTPVILITGFLGAGKTTLLNQLLSTHADKKISLILNEFGDIKLESKFVSVKGLGLVTELSGGCLCCVANVDLPRAVRYTLTQAPHTEYLLIEASGLSDPDPVRATLTSPALSSLIRLDTVVAVVDADNFARTAPAHPLLLSQIAEADFALLSKIEGHSKEEIDDLYQRVSTIGLGTKTFLWDRHFDTSVIFDPPLSRSARPVLPPHHHSHSYDQYFYQSQLPHDPARLSAILAELPENVLRVKGYSGDLLLQKVGYHVDLRSQNSPASSDETVILVIGTNLDKPALAKAFASATISR